MNDAYQCLICDRTYHDEEVVIGLLSEGAKKEQICEKLSSLMNINISNHDPQLYICKACYGQVQVCFPFITKGQKNVEKFIKNLQNSPSDNAIRTESNKNKRILPVNPLFSKYQFDVKSLFDAIISFLKDNNENLSSASNFENFVQYFGMNNHNSITNQLDIENCESVGNGIPASPLVLEVNMPCTSEPNINTNNTNHETNSSVPKNILSNAHIPIVSTNNLSNAINPGTNILRIITKYGPNVGTNNVNNRFAINNLNQSRINLPIVCKNNIIKSKRYCVVNKPPPLINRRRVVESSVNNHNNSVQLNGEINEISDDEVICLDDDDDDDDINHNDNNRNHNDNNNNGNGNSLQGLENSISPLNQWVLPSPPPPLIVNNINNNATTNIPKTYQCRNQNSTKKLIQFKRKVIYLRNNAPSTNISTEEMTVTPDMPLSTSNVGSSSNQVEYMDTSDDHTETLQVQPETEPSRVLPDTGFHFLFSTDETVDLTTKEDNTPKKTPIIRQKKTPKRRKAVASKKPTPRTPVAQRNRQAKCQLLRSSTSSTIEKKQTRNTSNAQYNLKAKGQLLLASTSSTTEQLDTSLTKPRPKRASAIANAAEIKNSGLFKLGRQIEGKNGSWLTQTTNISLTNYQCPICDKYYHSPESRQEHEIEMHSSLLESIHSPDDIVSTSGNTASLQQLHLFNYLQLCVSSKNKTTAIHELAKRTNLLKSFETSGHPFIGPYQCNYCSFDTNLIFASWAHMTSNHLICDFEKKSCLYCFLCYRILSKRTTFLKHLDSCVNKQDVLTINNLYDQFECVYCDNSFDSLIETEDHMWNHFGRY